METNDDFESQLADERLNQGLDDTFPSEPLTNRQARLQRLEAYEAAGFAKTDDLEALLTFATGDLMNIGYALSGVVKDSLVDTPPTIESVRQVAPTLNDLLRVTRQVDRFAQLELRIANARVQAEDAKNRAKSAAMLYHTRRAPPRPR